MSDGPLKIIHARVDKLEPLVNEASERFQLMGIVWTPLHDVLFGTATMVDKRELVAGGRAPVLIPANGRPFGQ